MKFEEILIELKNKRKIRRKVWKKEHYIYLNKKDMLKDSYDANVTLTQIELLADDWEVYNKQGEELIGSFCYNLILKNICMILEYTNYQYTVVDENGDIWHIGDDSIENIDLDICENKNVYTFLLETMKNIHNRLENK